MTEIAQPPAPTLRPIPGTVIKSVDVDRHKRARDALAEAERVLADAREHALRAKEAAEQDALERERLACVDGRKEGLEEALVMGAHLLALAQLRDQKIVGALAPSLAQLAVDVAEQIMGKPYDVEVAAAAVSAALTRAQRHRQVRLYVWPDALVRVREAAEAALATRGDGPRLICVEPDPRLEPGRVMLSSEQGYVDLGPGSQLAIASELLRSAFAARIAKLAEGDIDTAPIRDSSRMLQDVPGTGGALHGPVDETPSLEPQSVDHASADTRVVL